MTEEEAKTKWCPFALTHAHKYDTKMREVNDDLCIGSACMAWRWGPSQTEIARGHPHLESERPAGEGWEWVFGRWRRPNPTQPGFCGLAGKP